MELPSQMGNPLLSLVGIHLDATASSKEEAVALCGEKLIAIGAVQPGYPEAMMQREEIFSSYMGNGVAIPHGTDQSRALVNFGQLVFLRFKAEVPWGDERVRIAIGIAARDDEHGEILGNLAEVLLDDLAMTELLTTDSPEKILSLLT
jgi:PTS system mannitol-specific IIA component